LVLTKISSNIDVIAGLHPQSACQFFFTNNMVCSGYVSRIILSLSLLFYCRNTLVYANATSRILPTCDVTTGSLALSVPQAGDFVDLIVLYLCATSRGIIKQKHSL
jgi:hypothetical protein